MLFTLSVHHHVIDLFGRLQEFRALNQMPRIVDEDIESLAANFLDERVDTVHVAEIALGSESPPRRPGGLRRRFRLRPAGRNCSGVLGVLPQPLPVLMRLTLQYREMRL